jgi:hypothetical protein
MFNKLKKSIISEKHSSLTKYNNRLEMKKEGKVPSLMMIQMSSQMIIQMMSINKAKLY